MASGKNSETSGQVDDQKFDEQKLIKEAYAATLDPERLDTFEVYWESYLDTSLQKGGGKIDLQKTELDTHIKLALGIMERMRFDQDADITAQKIVDANSGFGFIIDNEQNIVAANSEAQSFVFGTKLFKNLPIDQDGKQDILKWIHSRHRTKASPYLFTHAYLNKQNTKTCLFITVIELGPCPESETLEHFFIASVEFELSEDVLPIIQSTYGFTNAEIDIARLLTIGRTPNNIAKQRQSSINTVRTQIKSILQKTNAKTVTDLVRNLSGMSARFLSIQSQTQRYIGPIKREKTIRRCGFTLPDGRYMEFIEQGHPQGYPVLNFHSMVSGLELTQTAAKKAVIDGLRIISPSRAGYGDSDPHLSTSVYRKVDDSVNDLVCLLDHLSINQVLIMSGRAGCYSHRMAVKHPKLVKGIVQINSVPLWHNSYLESLKSRHRIMIKTSIYAPKALPYMIRISKALIDSGRAGLFVNGIDKGNGTDEKALYNNEVYDVVTEGFKHVIKQGIQSFCSDLPTTHTDWVSDCQHLKVPITVLLGSDNSDQPSSAYDRYLELIPHAQMKIIQGAGVYLYLTHYDHVFRELKYIQSL